MIDKYYYTPSKYYWFKPYSKFLDKKWKYSPTPFCFPHKTNRKFKDLLFEKSVTLPSKAHALYWYNHKDERFWIKK